MCGGSAVEGKDSIQQAEGKKRCRYYRESVVRDVFTDGALGLGSLIGDWKWGPERKGKKRKRKGRKGRKKKEVTSR